MNPVFISHDGVVLDFTKPKTPTLEVANQQEDESLDVIAQREAERASTKRK